VLSRRQHRVARKPGMGHPELVKVVELRNPNIITGQIDINSGMAADDLFNIALIEFPAGAGGVHAHSVEYGALFVSHFIAFRKKDCTGGKIHREGDNTRNQKEKKTYAIQNDDNGIEVAAIFLMDAVRIDDGSAGGEQGGGCG